MAEVQYVVPSQGMSPGSEGKPTSGQSQNQSPKPPKQPNRLLEWIKDHKLLTASASVAVLLVALVSTVLTTQQSISLLGLQLNPLYNQAAICAPDDCGGVDNSVPIPGEPGPGEPTPGPGPGTPAPTPGPNGELPAPTGFQVAVRDEGCATQERTSATVTAGNSGSVTDANSKDPDCARINFVSGNVSSVPTTVSIYTNDFRIGTRVAESENGCTSQIDTSIKWTPWASDGGGTSQQAVGQASSNDPDCVWVHYETRPMPAGKGIRDVRVGIASGSGTQFTPWARSNGGWSAFSQGSNLRPTTVTLDVQTITVSQTPETVSIEGSIPNSTVGQTTNGQLTLSGTPNTPCSWTLVSVVPAVSGAAVNASDSNGASAVFTAQPTVAGDYNVTVRVTCQNGQTDTKTLPWTVSPQGTTPSGRLSITGNFPAGIVNQSYTTNVKTAGLEVSSCDWTLVSVDPSVSGAIVTRSDNAADTGESAAAFQATPQRAGLYKVTISAQCDTGNAQNTFDWVVGEDNDGPVPGNPNTCLDPNSIDKLTAIYRHWSPALGDHLYTNNNNERPAGYRFEGIAGYVYKEQMPNTVPVYRSGNPTLGAHYYTTIEADSAKFGYVAEGILGYTYASSVSGSAPWYRMYNDVATDFVHTASEQEKNAIKELGYQDKGTVAYLCGTGQGTDVQPLFRLWGAGDADHFYTTNFAERDALLTRRYTSEGIVGYIYGVRNDGSIPLYRAYSRALGDHLYTTSESEAHTAGYTYEGIMGYISATNTDKTIPVYRLYNAAIGDHFYTSSATEAAAATSHGYAGEGVTGYIYIAQ